MDQLTNIGLHTAIICLGIYFIIYIARYVATKVWISTSNKWVRGSIKWVGTMWLPIWPLLIGWFMLVTGLTSFLGMNFTGATTYTSLSGVRREMRVAVPIQAAAAVLGVTLWLVGRFV